jgi:hypothetical protein
MPWLEPTIEGGAWMKADEILIAKTAPAFTYEPTWWRFCVMVDGRFEYQKMSWREKTGESTETTIGKLSSAELATIRQIIESLDDVALEDFVIEDAGSAIIDYRRADNSTASIEQCGEPMEGDQGNDVFVNAWLAIKQIAAAHG